MEMTMNTMVLVGDIGGTKTVLALFPQHGVGIIRNLLCHEQQYVCARYPSFEDIVEDYLASVKGDMVVSSACFAVAGLVQHGTTRITNLPWSLDAVTIVERFHFTRVHLLNDLEALALAVPLLESKDVVVLRKGQRQKGGAMAVVAPGTGLGVASLMAGEPLCSDGVLQDSSRFLDDPHPVFRAHASEAGHMSFAPRNSLQMDLLRYMMHFHDHISYEKVCSGSAFPLLYRFLRDEKGLVEPDWLAEKLQSVEDQTPVILASALGSDRSCLEICRATLRLFLDILATVISDVAMAYLPTAGIFLGGGLPPRLLALLQEEIFLKQTVCKGRFSTLCSTMPLVVITQQNPALVGAALWVRNFQHA